MSIKQNNYYLWKLIANVKSATIPERWYTAKQRIKKDASHLDNILNRKKPPHIYGVNTLVGHLDNVSLEKEEINHFQDYLLKNHSIGVGDEMYNDFEVTCMTYAKLHAYSLGGSGITPELYENLIKVGGNPSFKANVPKHASYSSGDVIPAAHWASTIKDILKNKYNYQLQRKEGLSLINGSFIHVGIAIAKLLKIRPIWSLYNYNSTLYAKILKNKPSNFSNLLTTNEDDSMNHSLNWAKESLGNDGIYNVQDPISIRSFPQVSSAFFNSISAYIDSIEEQLARRSDNPLILHEEESALSQASFLAPMISLATSQLIESLLLVMWQVERRVHFLLSGNVKGIPLNASTKEDPLGFIQVPKMISALLEEARLKGGRRTFASGSSTSYGVEDLWTNGLSSLEILDELLKKANTILSIELSLIIHIKKKFLHDDQFYDKFEKFLEGEQLRDQFNNLIYYSDKEKLPIDYNLQPFEKV